MLHLCGVGIVALVLGRVPFVLKSGWGRLASRLQQIYPIL